MDKHSGTLECLSTARATQKIFCNLVLTKGLLSAIIKLPKGKERKEMIIIYVLSMAIIIKIGCDIIDKI